MAWQTIVISNPVKLSIKNNNLMLSKLNEQSDPIPMAISEISVIVIDNLQSIITTKLFELAAQNNIVIIFTDSQHMPAGIYQPYHQHSRYTEHSLIQLKTSQPFKNNLWQQIIKAKISNQAIAYQILHQQPEQDLLAFANQVLSGDKTNIEAHAAKIYWRRIMQQPKFKRQRGHGFINSALDYGYIIFRSSLARFITAYGLLPFLGLHHKSGLNAFNLADDLIEPFRPIVDIKVYQIYCNLNQAKPANTFVLPNELNHTVKVELVNLLNQSITINGTRTTVLTAMEIATQSLLKAMQTKKTTNLMTPTINLE